MPKLVTVTCEGLLRITGMDTLTALLENVRSAKGLVKPPAVTEAIMIALHGYVEPNMNWKEHIVSDHEILAGKPTQSKGTRLSGGINP